LGLIRATATSRALHPGWRWLREVFVLSALAYVLVWNVGLWRDARYVAPEPLKWLGETFNLRQRWGMFTRLPSTGWFLIPGKLSDGTVVDLFAAGGPLPSYEEARRPLPTTPPQRVSATFRSVPWLTFFLTASEGHGSSGSSGQLQGYGRYLCREWNNREKGERQLQGFELIYMRRPVDPEPRAHPPTDYQRTLLWGHNCFG
jgi:hypothetical protein